MDIKQLIRYIITSSMFAFIWLAGSFFFPRTATTVKVHKNIRFVEKICPSVRIGWVGLKSEMTPVTRLIIYAIQTKIVRSLGTSLWAFVQTSHSDCGRRADSSCVPAMLGPLQITHMLVSFKILRLNIASWTGMKSLKTVQEVVQLRLRASNSRLCA